MKETNLEKAFDRLTTVVDETPGAGQSGKELDKVKLYFWIGAVLLIVVQIIALKWWAILTGIITFILAMLGDKLISDREEIKEAIQIWMSENRREIVVYLIALIAIVVEIFTIGWWSILAAPATLIVAYLLNKLIDAIVGHFYY